MTQKCCHKRVDSFLLSLAEMRLSHFVNVQFCNYENRTKRDNFREGKMSVFFRGLQFLGTCNTLPKRNIFNFIISIYFQMSLSRRGLACGLLGLLLVPLAIAQDAECPADQVSFEMVTGYVYTAPQDMLDSQPGTLMLTDCINTCRQNSSCRAINYETGLCVLFASNADDSDGKELI